MNFDITSSFSSSWARSTASEIQEMGSRDGSVLVLPIGSIEQHGDHLPVATDTILVTEIAAAGIERVEGEVPILMLPPFWSGYSPHHLSFGGTLSLELDHMRQALEDIAETALSNGFDALLLLNGHGGNISLVNGAVSTVGTDADDEILGLTYFQLAGDFIQEIRESDPGGMGHGGEFETSLMLHLQEELVREGELEGTEMDEPYDRSITDMFEGGPLAVYRGFEEYTSTGAIGTPELASRETGRRIYERLGDELAEVLREIHERNTS